MHESYVLHTDGGNVWYKSTEVRNEQIPLQGLVNTLESRSLHKVGLCKVFASHLSLPVFM